MAHLMSFGSEEKQRKDRVRKWATYSDLSVGSAEGNKETWNGSFDQKTCFFV